MVEVILSTIAIVVSVISIIVSAIAAHVANKQNLRLNRINMKARYYEKIFDEYLIRKIPQKIFEQEDQAEVYIEIQRKLEKLYRYINDNYTGNE